MSQMMILNRERIKQSALALALMLLAACGGNIIEKGDSAPNNPPDVSGIPNAVPKVERIRPQNQKSYVVLGKRYYPMSSSNGYREKGIASWYGKKFHGRKTATGETYDMYQMTAAHKTLPLPSYAEVTNLDNGRKIIVRVNDRGPFHGGRIIDLSYAGATKLGIIGHGTGKVEVRAINARDYGASQPATFKPSAKLAKVAAVNQHAHEDEINSHQNDAGPELYLQVGTFSTIGRAEAFKQKLAEHLDETVFLMPVYRSQGALYRVRVGPLANVEASEVMAMKLKSMGVAESHAVVE
jgi:rare lipoprotein A